VRAALVLGAPPRERAQLLQLRRQPVARALQLGEVEQARAAGPTRPRVRAPRRRQEREAVGQGPRQLALDPGDLPSQLSSRGALVDGSDRCDPPGLLDSCGVLGHGSPALLRW